MPLLSNLDIHIVRTSGAHHIIEVKFINRENQFTIQ